MLCQLGTYASSHSAHKCKNSKKTKLFLNRIITMTYLLINALTCVPLVSAMALWQIEKYAKYVMVIRKKHTQKYSNIFLFIKKYKIKKVGNPCKSEYLNKKVKQA